MLFVKKINIVFSHSQEIRGSHYQDKFTKFGYLLHLNLFLYHQFMCNETGYPKEAY